MVLKRRDKDKERIQNSALKSQKNTTKKRKKDKVSKKNFDFFQEL